MLWASEVGHATAVGRPGGSVRVLRFVSLILGIVRSVLRILRL